jgi:small subunit ribosomal protein S3
MGHKINATGFRMGVSLDWLSKWFGANQKDYRTNLHEDLKIREFVNDTFKQAEVESINISRTHTSLEVVVMVSRPGLAIGREGKLIEKAKKDLQKKFKGRAIDLQIKGVKQPQLSATVVAKQIADGIEKRRSVKSLVKRAVETSTKAGVAGIKIWVAGRLTGGEHANMYKKQIGRVPLQTLRAQIDYAYERAHSTKAGILSVKVWIYKGEVY